MNIQLSDHFTYGRLLRYALPSMGIMLFTSVYSVVDGLFVSRFTGKIPFAAVNLVMPPIMIAAAVGFMIGTGGTALVARLLGAGDRERANRTFSMLVEAELVSGILISVLGWLIMPRLAIWLGATPEMLPHCVTYGRINMIFNSAFMLQQMFQTFFPAAEKPGRGLQYTVAAGLTNILGDALLVGWLKTGVAGAAWATGLSMCVGGFLPLLYFARENDSLLHFHPVTMELRPIAGACYNGLSEMVGMISGSVVGIVYNLQLLKFLGEDGVAAFGVLMYVNFIFVAVFLGYDMGASPVISFHYGAGHEDELKSLLRKSILLMLGGGIAMTAISELLAVPVSAVYVGYDAGLMALTVHAFRIYSVSFTVTGLAILGSSFFTALNNGTVSAILSFFRTFLLDLGAVLILPLFLKGDGIWWAISVAETGGMLLSAVFLAALRERYHYW